MKNRLIALAALIAASSTAVAQSESEFDVDLLPGLQTNVVRAQLVPLRKSLFSAGISAILEGVAVQEGDIVKKGDLLLAFDCDRFDAAFGSAQAKVKGAEARLEVNRELVKLNSVGPLEVQLNEADLEAARGEVDAVRAQLKHCEIRAPFDGAVTSRMVEQYQFVEEGEDLLELVSRDQLEVRMLMPSTSLAWLKLGTNFTMFVEELDLAMPGEIVRIGGAVDPVSLTIPVFGRLEDSPPALLPGMSGRVQFVETGLE